MKEREIEKKLVKRFFIISIMLLLVLLIPIRCQAAGLLEDLGELEQYGQIQGETTVFKDKVANFLGIIQIVGSALALICLIVLGIKYMMGSVEEKAAYKKTLMPYFIGALMVFGIGNLLKVFYLIVINAF